MRLTGRKEIPVWTRLTGQGQQIFENADQAKSSPLDGRQQLSRGSAIVQINAAPKSPRRKSTFPNMAERIQRVSNSAASQWTTRTSMVSDLQIPQEKRCGEFIVIYSPLLRYWIRQKNVPLSAVEDVLQESLRSVYVGIGQFHRRKFSTGNFRGWLRIIVNRRVADYFRQSPREENLSSKSLGNLDARPTVTLKKSLPRKGRYGN